MEIRYLKRNEIDSGRWDEVIARSPMETLYPYSWYLDAAAENWSALMIGDYRFVMPLVWKKKYGIRYLYQPFYTQQLGVYSSEFVDPSIIQAMLDRLYRKFRFAGMNLNTRNLVGETETIRVEDKSNYVLALDRPYDPIFAAYSTNAKRNTRKAYELNDTVEKTMTPVELVSFKQKHDVMMRSEQAYRWLTGLLEQIMNRSAGVIYSSRDDEGETDAAAFFGLSGTRAIYLVSASSEQGKENRAMFKLVDSFIRDHADSGLILDFEGSNIPNVARFFAGFGARPELYQYISFSRLPAFLNRIRKHG